MPQPQLPLLLADTARTANVLGHEMAQHVAVDVRGIDAGLDGDLLERAVVDAGHGAAKVGDGLVDVPVEQPATQVVGQADPRPALPVLTRPGGFRLMMPGGVPSTCASTDSSVMASGRAQVLVTS